MSTVLALLLDCRLSTESDYLIVKEFTVHFFCAVDERDALQPFTRSSVEYLQDLK